MGYDYTNRLPGLKNNNCAVCPYMELKACKGTLNFSNLQIYFVFSFFFCNFVLGLRVWWHFSKIQSPTNRHHYRPNAVILYFGLSADFVRCLSGPWAVLIRCVANVKMIWLYAFWWHFVNKRHGWHNSSPIGKRKYMHYSVNPYTSRLIKWLSQIRK